MKDFWVKFSFLLDPRDRRNFYKFLVLLFVGGFFSLLGVATIIPFVSLLIDPQHIQHIPLICHLGYKSGLAICVLLLILSFWIKNIVVVIVLKNQVFFLEGFEAKIRKKLFSSYIYSPYSYHIKRSSSELINNINAEVKQLSEGVILQLGTFLNEGISSLIITLALVWINPVFSFVIVGTIFVSMNFFMRKLKAKIQYYGESRSAGYLGLLQNVIQGLGGLKETKIYQKETFFVKKVDSYAYNISRSGAFAGVLQQSPRLLMETVSVTVILSLVFIFVMVGYSSAQMLVLLSVFGVAAVQLLPSISRLLYAIVTIKYNYVSLDKIYAELKVVDEFKQEIRESQRDNKKDEPIIFARTIELKNIYFSYEGKSILRDLSLTIPKNKRIAFVGYSGAGKTTLVDIILGLLKPTRGELIVDGLLITPQNLGMWYKHFGYIPQLIYIYDCSLRENIAFGIASEEIDDAQVWRCLEMASLETFVREKCEDGLNTLVGENGIKLSGGQRQRLGIARALYCNPDILVMDEATAALDNQTESAVTQALARASYGRTTIAIAHRLTTIKDYDVIYVVEDGKIVSSGTYDYLFKYSVAFQKMVGT